MIKTLIIAAVLTLAAAAKFGAPFPHCYPCGSVAELHVPIIIDGIVS